MRAPSRIFAPSHCLLSHSKNSCLDGWLSASKGILSPPNPKFACNLSRDSTQTRPLPRLASKSNYNGRCNRSIKLKGLRMRLPMLNPKYRHSPNHHQTDENPRLPNQQHPPCYLICHRKVPYIPRWKYSLCENNWSGKFLHDRRSRQIDGGKSYFCCLGAGKGASVDNFAICNCRIEVLGKSSLFRILNKNQSLTGIRRKTQNNQSTNAELSCVPHKNVVVFVLLWSRLLT